MRKRTRYSLLIVIVLLAALVGAIILRKNAPPEVARLLPESDAIVYLDLKPIRSATHFDRNPVVRDAEFQRFVDSTGFIFERDLDEAAFALTRMPNPNGPNGPVAYSEVFRGHFDGKRLHDYLRISASSIEMYAGHEIFAIPVENRILRVTQLGYDMVAASNNPTAEQIHVILDRYRASASPFSGSTLLNAHYGDVPLLSLAWGIGRIGLPFSQDGNVAVAGLQLPLPEDTTFVASLSYAVSIRLRIEEITRSENDATKSAESLSNLLQLFKGIEQSQVRTPQDQVFLELLNTLKIDHRKDRTILTGGIPIDLVRRIASNAPTPSP